MPNLGSDTDSKLSEVAANPIQVSAVRINPVTQNGVGFAPFFMCLAMWVGAIAMFLLFPALDKRRSVEEKFFVSALRSLRPTLPLAFLQAAFVVGGLELLLDLSAKELWPLFGICLITSVCFLLVNQGFMAFFGYRGRFLSALMLLLQITSSGATFPIETTPKFFQIVHPLLPMSYSAQAVREHIAGAGLGFFPGWQVILIWTAFGIGLTLIGAARHHGMIPMKYDPAFAFPRHVQPKEES